MKRILVVEDALTLRKDIVEMLEFEGFEVDSAENGKVGLERVYASRPDLIISDIMMPIMDGMRLLETLRGDSATASIPLIFLTARTDRLDIRQGMELGADDFVTKPFHAAELLATVQTQIRKQQQRAEEIERRMEDLRGNIILALPHELRTPLNAILGFSELMMSDAMTLSADRVRDMAKHIHNAGKRLYALVDNYLLYAQLELLLTDPRRVAEARLEFALHPELTIAASAYGCAAHYVRAERLQLDLQPLAQLAISEIYLKKLVDELIDNAFKFSPKDSVVAVRASAQDNFYEIQINDQGVGIGAEQAMQIGAYMQFSRRLQEQQGSGLGLIIARRLCDVYGGHMMIESDPGAGTTITVTLPMTSAP
ncbi:MAG: response regulator [Chloroflexota bacterium]|nr:response regulator [Chloroflexota bacterium]